MNMFECKSWMSCIYLASPMTRNLLMASTVMEKQRATRKTALMRAPTTWQQREMVSCTLLHLGPGPPECVPFPLLGAHGDTGGEEGDGDGDSDGDW